MHMRKIPQDALAIGSGLPGPRLMDLSTSVLQRLVRSLQEQPKAQQKNRHAGMLSHCFSVPLFLTSIKAFTFRRWSSCSIRPRAR
jgi:hypothetical protein